MPTHQPPRGIHRELGRTFGDQLKKHLRAPSPIHQHRHSTEHPVSPNCFTIVDTESQGVTRNIKGSMYIQVNDPSLNRNLGKYQLLHLGLSFTGYTITPAQIVLLYHPPYHNRTNAPYIYYTKNRGYTQPQ